MAVLIYTDSANGRLAKSSFEVTYYGSKIASQLGVKAVVLTYGNVADDELKKLGNFGASKVSIAKNLSSLTPNKIANLIEHTIQSENASIIVFSHNHTSKAVAPLLSARLKAGFVAGAVGFPTIDSSFTIKKSVFSGNAFAEMEVLSDKKIISLLPNSITPETLDTPVIIEEINFDLGNAEMQIKEVKKQKGTLSLPEADIVVSGGRGLKGPENWGMIEELAKELGAATACSRPVSDVDWRPHHEHVGQTGTTIRPNLYIAIGISGAIQHLAGVNGSKVMVVINKDPEAPFFKAADYGIIGDAFEVVPKLIEAVKKLK